MTSELKPCETSLLAGLVIAKLAELHEMIEYNTLTAEGYKQYWAYRAAYFKLTQQTPETTVLTPPPTPTEEWEGAGFDTLVKVLRRIATQHLGEMWVCDNEIHLPYLVRVIQSRDDKLVSIRYLRSKYEMSLKQAKDLYEYARAEFKALGALL